MPTTTFRLARPLLLAAGLLLPCLSVSAQQPSLRILLPERTRLLQDQLVDLVLEVRNATSVSNLRVTAGSADLTPRFSAPGEASLDCDTTPDRVLRADLVGLQQPGMVRLTASLTADGTTLTATRDILVRPFTIPASGRRSVVLYIGDAMGTAYRDAARLVARSVETTPGQPGLREGFYDSLLEMDRMPISGMAITFGFSHVVPDSANTGTNWITGNKTFNNAVNVFADGTDCVWRAGANASNLPQMLDNPRVESLFQYMKRKFGYRTGIVSTADVTDATPAVQGSYSAFRQTRFEIARQYLDNPMLGGQPALDVIMGGGRDQFLSSARRDGRNLLQEFEARGYQRVENASAMEQLTAASGRVLGLFRGGAETGAADGIRATSDANMEVAYDKLSLPRPASEPQPNFGSWTSQPMLDRMTAKAIEVLAGPGGTQPFVLMVEGASIDKQSHPNHAAGVIWDTIEMDRAVGVGRTFLRSRQTPDTLLVVTADHDQSMHILGVTEMSDADYFNNLGSLSMSMSSAVGAQTLRVFPDAPVNVRAAYPYVNGSDPSTSTGSAGPPTPARAAGFLASGFPNYKDPQGTGYPMNFDPSGAPLRRLAVGFRTGDHTGSSVPVTAEGPGAFLFTGYMDQTDLFFKMAASLTGDTAEGDAFVANVLLNPKYPATAGK